MRQIFRHFQSLLIAMLLLLATGTAQAVPVQGLYTAKVTVSDQTSSTRKQVLPSMFREVLGRLLGEPDPEQLLIRWPELTSETRQAERYLAQFLYQRLDNDDEQASLLLRAEFEAAAIDRLIQRLQLPQWGVDRPEVLLVLAWRDDKQREVLSSSASSQTAAEISAELEQVATRSGIPIALPLMDLSDQRRLPEAELRAGFTDGLLGVASRYGADAVLFGRLSLAPPTPAAEGEAAQTFASRQAEVSWSLHQNGQASRYADNFGSLRNGLEAGVWMAMRALAERYAVQANSTELATGELAPLQEAEPLLVKVLGIKNLVDLKLVEKHLAERTVVKSVRLTALQQQLEAVAVFAVELKSGPEKLEQALAVGRLLRPSAAPAGLTSGDVSTIGLEPISQPNNSVLEPEITAAATPQTGTVTNAVLWYRLY